jgi:hypothetical protein
MIASRVRVGPANARETLHVGHARRRWKKESVQDGRGNSVDDTGNVPEATGNSTGEPGNTPDEVGNVTSAISHSRGA